MSDFYDPPSRNPGPPPKRSRGVSLGWTLITIAGIVWIMHSLMTLH